MLEKLVDSMTCKLSQRPKSTSNPFFGGQARPKVKKCKKKPMIIIDSTPKQAFFGEKWMISEMSTATGRPAEQNTQTSPTIHPDKLQLTHYVGPPPENQKSKRM